MYNEIKSIKEPTEEDCYLGIIRAYQREVDGLQQENKQLKEDLRVSKSNEETYSLEMQEITKILGLDEDTLFDDVKDYAKQLKSYNKLCIKSSFTTRKLKELQQRIDKAIDFIKHNAIYSEFPMLPSDTLELLEILGDKEMEE